MASQMLDSFFATDYVCHVLQRLSIDWEPSLQIIQNHVSSPFEMEVQSAVDQLILFKKVDATVQFIHHFEFLEKTSISFHLLLFEHMNHMNYLPFNHYALMIYCVEVSLFAALAYNNGISLAPYIAMRCICRQISFLRLKRYFKDESYLALQSMARNLVIYDENYERIYFLLDGEVV